MLIYVHVETQKSVHYSCSKFWLLDHKLLREYGCAQRKWLEIETEDGVRVFRELLRSTGFGSESGIYIIYILTAKRISNSTQASCY